MKKRITQVEKQRLYIEDVKIQFCEMFDCTEQEYGELEFETGLMFIEAYDLPKGSEYSKTFWNWWKLQSAYYREKIINNPDKKHSFQGISPTNSILKQIKDEAQSSIAQETVRPL